MEEATERAISYFRRWETIATKKLEKEMSQSKRMDALLYRQWSVPFWHNPLSWLNQHRLSWKNDRLKKKIATETVLVAEWAIAEIALRQGNLEPAIQALNRILKKIPSEIYSDIKSNISTFPTSSFAVFEHIASLRNALLGLKTKKMGSKI